MVDLAVAGERKSRVKARIPSLEKNRRRMVELLNELAPGEGFHTTILDGVKLRRSDRNEPRTPVMYEPSVYFVASGRKKGYVGDRCIVYDANNYLCCRFHFPLSAKPKPVTANRCSEYPYEWMSPSSAK